MHPLTLEFATLFEGHSASFGTYTLTNEVKPNGKRIGKAASFNKTVTKELYSRHLLGIVGLGIVPITKESTCKFGAVDIDEYPLDLEKLNNRIAKLKLPVTLCRTKSGGAHLYLFTSVFIAASLMQKKLREIASALGYGEAEIYPRQAQILVERGDVGNWINLPYFDEVNTMRYAYGFEPGALTLVDFITHATKMRINEKELSELSLIENQDLKDGPPCLQHLIKQGFPEGTRNNGLMNLGVYARKAFGENWQAHVEEYNTKYLQPPLESAEVLQIISSLRRKEYSYTCKAQPLQPFCNASVCRTCKHGVSGADLGMPKMGTLTKILTVPPIWFLDVETEEGIKRMDLSTDELQSPLLFQKRCMEVLSTMPVILKRENWSAIVQKLLTEVVVIDMPAEATPQGQMLSHLESFCMSRVTAKTMDEILLGKPWINDHYIHFRLNDFLSYLTMKKYNLLTLNKIATYIRDIRGYKKDFLNIKGKGVNVYVLPVTTFETQTESFTTPPQPKEVI